MARTLVFLFFTQLAVGGAWTMLLIPLREAGHGFFRFNGLLAVAFLALAMWAGPYGAPDLAGLSALHLQPWTVTLFGLAAAALLAHVRAVLSGRLPWDRRLLLLSALAGSAALVGDGLQHPAGAEVDRVHELGHLTHAGVGIARDTERLAGDGWQHRRPKTRRTQRVGE